MKSKFFKFLALLALTMLLMFLCRESIFRGFAKFLIVEMELEKVAYGFVLSGGAFDRGNKAAELYHEGKVVNFVCTGANKSPDLKALDMDTFESDLTKLQMLKKGVPDSLVLLIREGTSTMEESEIILDYCLNHHLNSIAIVSSKYHTRRVSQVFTNKFKDQGITVYIQGAASSSYDEMNWWKSEQGLIALNNEYLKQLYYLVNY